jgi:hypothetical protein
MPTVIDQLFVTLGFDPKEFKKGTKEASAAGEQMARDVDGQVKRTKKAEGDLGAQRKQQAAQQRRQREEQRKQEKERETNSRKSLEVYSKVKNEIMGIGAALLGAAGAKEFIANIVGGNAALYRQSQLLGNSMKSLDKWGQVAEKWGGSRDAVIGAISGVQQAVKREQAYGGSQAQGALAQLGLSPDDVNDADVMIKKLRESLRGLSPQDKEVRLAQAGLQGLSSIIQLSDTDFAEYVRAAEAASAKTEEMGRTAQEADAAWTGVKNAAQGASDTLLVALKPQLKETIELLNKFSAWVSDHKGETGEFFQFLSGLVSTIGEGWRNIIGYMGDFVEWIGKITSKLDNSVFGGMLGKLRNFLSDKLGETSAKIMAAGGNKDAQEALDRMNGGSRTSSGPVTGAPGNTGDPIAFFMNKGYTREQAAGIVANLHAESRMNTGAVGDSGKAYGIAQWHPDRQAKFKEVFGREMKGSSLEQQMEFVAWELKNTEAGAGDKLRQAKTAREAGALVSKLYERPADMQGEMARRGSYAEQILAQNAAVPGGSGKNVTVETRIGEVNIQTQATDAAGIARDAQTALNNHPLLTYSMTAAAN